MKWFLILTLLVVPCVLSDPVPHDAGKTQLDPPEEADVEKTDPKPQPPLTNSIGKILPPRPPSGPEESEQSDNDPPPHPPNSRKKRYIEANAALWPNGNVKYVYQGGASFPAGKKIQIINAIKYIEARTCMSFTEIDAASSETRLTFVNVASGCYCGVGYYNSSCSCCGGNTCRHELLHAMGLHHEQQRSDRDRYESINFPVIQTGLWYNFRRKSASSINITDPDVFDVGSTMHYSATAFQTDLFGQSISTHNSDFTFGSSFFYPIREINMLYNCQQAACADFAGTCENDGYVTQYNGVCQCVCPDDLDPKKNCAAPITSDPVYDWPRGSYAFPEGEGSTNCPTELGIGYRKHYSQGYSWSQSGANPMKGLQDYYSTEYKFCVSDNRPTSNNVWQEGQYCIFRKGGTCPERFNSGYVQFDDKIVSAGLSNIATGVLPDGVFGNDTRFEFCCRNDGSESYPLEMPTTNSFILFNENNASPDCQAVKDFNSKKFYFVFDNLDVAGVTIASSGGHKPKMYTYAGAQYLFYICHYIPLNLDCGGVIELSENNRVATFNTPNYPANYADNAKCRWLIKAPANSRIYLDFDTFNVDCSDNVEVRVFNLGETHPKFCKNAGKTYKSYKSEMIVIFHTSSPTVASGFSASLSYVAEQENCYLESDFGESYRGVVDFTREFDKCIPWDEAVNCEFSQHLNENLGLESNYCRNPGHGDRPWCYINKDCTRASCDVCLKEGVYDRFADCSTLVSADSTFCATDDRAFTYCRKTCDSSFNSPATPPSVSDISCNPPSAVPSDGNTPHTPKSSYSVGEKITYTCNINSASSVTLTCNTEGQFGPLYSSACKVCDDGWIAFDNRCYKRGPYNKNYYSARDACTAESAVFIMPKTQKEHDFLLTIRDMASETWIGVNDIAHEGVWRWFDNTVADASDLRFGHGQPSNSSANRDCASLLPHSVQPVWIDKDCTNTGVAFSYVCQKDQATASCNDVLNDCLTRLSQVPDFCEKHVSYCRQTCGVCGGCANGGILWQGQCLYYQSSGLHYTQAQNMCNATGAVLADVQNIETNNFLKDNFFQNGATKLWLGATDKVVEGTWRWDRTGEILSYTNWQSSSNAPNNYYNLEHCLRMDSDGTWNDVYCQYYNENPYICSTSVSVPCVATKPASSSNAILTSANTVLNNGLTTYACSTGYQLLSGSLTRTCSSGSFLEAEPVCEADQTTNILTPSNDVRLIRRYQTLSSFSGHMFTGDFHNFHIPRSGVIVAWEYVSGVAGQVGFMVFSPHGSMSKLEGFNMVTTAGNGRISKYTVPVADRIAVTKGDRIGVWFPENKQTIDINYHKQDLTWRYPEQKIRKSYLTFTSSAELSLGTTYDMFITDIQCSYGLVSLRAIIGPAA